MKKLVLLKILNYVLLLYIITECFSKKEYDLMPEYSDINFIINNLFIPLKHTLHNLDINNKYDNIRLSNDAFSICIKIMETAKQNIITNPYLLNQIDFEKMKYIDKYLDLMLVEKPKNIEEWCIKTFGKTTFELLLFSQIYLKFEMIQLLFTQYNCVKILSKY
jgi:hypothetical protein